MEDFLAEPAAFHDLGEVSVSECVAKAYFGLCLEPADDDREDDLKDGAGCEEDDEVHEVAFGVAGRYVYESFADPDVCHGYRDSECADEADGGYAEPVAFGGVPEPAEYMGQFDHKDSYAINSQR